jgi:hypothetical protein
VASAGAVEKLTGWLKRKGLTPWRAALGVGTWTGVKPGSRLKPAIGPAPPAAAASAAKAGKASPASSAAWTCGEDRN